MHGGNCGCLHPYPICSMYPSGILWPICFQTTSIIGPLIKVLWYRWNIGNVFLVWYLCPLYAKHPLGPNGYIIRFLLDAALLFLPVNMHIFQCYNWSCVLSVGDVKFAIFLWHVWFAERVFASALLQQGILVLQLWWSDFLVLILHGFIRFTVWWGWYKF